MIDGIYLLRIFPASKNQRHMCYVNNNNNKIRPQVLVVPPVCFTYLHSNTVPLLSALIASLAYPTYYLGTSAFAHLPLA